MPRPVILPAAAVMLAVAFFVPAGAETSRGFSAGFGAASVPDGAGGTYVAWSTDRDGPGDIYLQRVTASGDVAPGWPAAGLAVCTAPGMQIESGILPDGAGGVLIGWADFRDQPFNPFGGTADFYAQRVSSAGAPQWTANGVRVLAGFNVAADLGAAADGSGGAFLVWSLGDASDDGNVYALHFTGSGALATGWNPAGEPVCTDPFGQYEPVVAPDGSDGCYVVWEDDRDFSNEIYAQRLNASGDLQWTVDGVSLTGGNGGISPAVCTDGAGGLLAFWIASPDIVGQRYDGAGAEQWTSGGLTVGAVSFGEEVLAYPDPASGAYVVWRDQAIGTAIEAQRVNGAGVTQWTAGGVTVCSTTGNRFVENAVIEGDGSLSLLWEDERSMSSTDLYVRRVSPTGTPLWTANGVALTTTARDQLPVLWRRMAWAG